MRAKNRARARAKPQTTIYPMVLLKQALEAGGCATGDRGDRGDSGKGGHRADWANCFNT